MLNAMIILITIILISSIFTFTPNIAIYATNDIPVIDGTVSEFGCKRIEGRIVTATIDANHTQTIELCNFGTKNFRIVQSEACVEAVAIGKDPDTGNTYGFPSPCDLPKPCDEPNGWGDFFRASRYYDITRIQIEGKEFNIITYSKGALCNILEFLPSEKKITVTTNDVKGFKTSMDIVIPNELLSGEFKVIVDEKVANFILKDTKTLSLDIPPSSRINLELDFEESVKKIDITGTQVISEFPAFGLIIFAATMFFVLATSLISRRKLRNRF